MHFEILVEDRSGQRMLEVLVPRIIGPKHTFKVHPYRGIGQIPKGLKGTLDPSKRILLDNLPRLLRGYGATFAEYPPDYGAAVILVCDLDDKCLKAFRVELLTLLNSCDPRPETRFCIAIEEGEAWLLGDQQAITTAFPKARTKPLNTYQNDQICGTWELLADAVFPGGAMALKARGRQAVGAEKLRWAEKIAPHMDVKNNRSPSFCYFRDKLRRLI